MSLQYHLTTSSRRPSFVPMLSAVCPGNLVGDLQEHTKRICKILQIVLQMGHRIEERIDPDTAERLKAAEGPVGGASGELEPCQAGSGA